MLTSLLGDCVNGDSNRRVEKQLGLGDVFLEGDEELVDEGPAALGGERDVVSELTGRVGVADDRVVGLKLGAAREVRGCDRLMSGVIARKTLSGIALSGTRSTTTHIRQSSSSKAPTRSCSAHVQTAIGRFRSS